MIFRRSWNQKGKHDFATTPRNETVTIADAVARCTPSSTASIATEIAKLPRSKSVPGTSFI